ncbi:glycosyltransferase family 4 protein [Algibacter pectinivorans]|uniref:Glycosyltransferase involved in cell wall bisynthesis n=1 Tax=Algibacter pectinivorans TaxID=870482 RepID=A0A1I1PJD9_9FLAO|nr:glycosyltransferase family 4 protein [Algibacter pectinivorans]SFD07828.1 Glycosyltransferase involved in cell wall bisynthesis [Algibacter pectinivorans]
MKLVYIVNRIDGPGGLERVLSIKASMLADKYDYDVHIITLNQDRTDLFYEFSNKIVYHNVIAVGNPILKVFKYVNSLRKTIASINPDVIAVCDDGLKGLFLPILLGKPAPMVYERHVSRQAGNSSENKSILSKFKIGITFKLMNFGAKFYNKFVVLTNGNLNEWRLKNIMVIPNPLSFYPEESSTLSNKIVLAVGKQSYQKGYDRLLKSWQMVNKKFPDWTLHIYGTISKKENLDGLAKTLNIKDIVNFYPPVKNIKEKYKEASVYVLSSRYEGFGMVLTEAMAYGVPCVAFNCPYGPSDIITDKKNGIIVPNGDVKGLALGVIKLINNEELRKNMGQKAKIDVKRYFPEQIVAQWDNLFQSLIKK